jgi:hypothetical protein
MNGMKGEKDGTRDGNNATEKERYTQKGRSLGNKGFRS